MVERKKYDIDSIMKIVARISTSLERSVDCYLIGGLGLIHHGLKAATKDIDIVFNSREEMSFVITHLRTLGYEKPDYLQDVYLQMGTQAILIGPEGFMFDMFVKRVCGCLEITQGMMERSTPIELEGKLKVKKISVEDIFLFKSITSRPDDLVDMANIVAGGIDWNIITNELKAQPDYWKWLMRYFIRLEELEEQFGVTPPLKNEILIEAEIAAGMGLILTRLDTGTISKDDAMYLLDKNDSKFGRTVLEKMIELEMIRIIAGSITLSE